MKELTVLLLLGGGWFASAGEISGYYHKQTRAATNWAERVSASLQKSRTIEQVRSTNHSVTEIGIERAGSFWGGPIYTFVARSDGTFRYKGDKSVERTVNSLAQSSFGSFTNWRVS